MYKRRPSFRPSFERLEDRCTPAGGTVTGSLLNGVWTLTGDASDNDISVNSTGASGAFTVVGNNGTSVAGTTSPTGVVSISISLLAGADKVTFNANSTPITIKGTLSIDGGTEDNEVDADHLTVKKDMSITNGTHLGTDKIFLNDLKVGGNCTITNGDGDTDTEISADSGFSSIKRDLSITNGTGEDVVAITDTNIGGNLTDNNGHGSGGGVAGYFYLYNSNNTTKQANVGGSIDVTFEDGDVDDYNGIWDTTIKGDVTLNLGSGNMTTNFDGFSVAKPVVIKGNLSITGTGTNTVTVGTQYLHTGVTVGRNLSLDFTSLPTLEFENLTVKKTIHIAT